MGNGKTYSCDVAGCGEIFKRTRDLKKHKIQHEDPDRLLYCDWDGCGFYTLYSRNLQVHLDAIHTKKKDVHCPDMITTGVSSKCPYKTSDPSLLTRHRKRKHGHEPAPRRTRSRHTGPYEFIDYNNPPPPASKPKAARKRKTATQRPRSTRAASKRKCRALDTAQDDSTSQKTDRKHEPAIAELSPAGLTNTTSTLHDENITSNARTTENTYAENIGTTSFVGPNSHTRESSASVLSPNMSGALIESPPPVADQEEHQTEAHQPGTTSLVDTTLLGQETSAHTISPSGIPNSAPIAHQQGQQPYPPQLGTPGFVSPSAHMQRSFPYAVSPYTNNSNVSSAASVAHQQAQQTYPQQTATTSLVGPISYMQQSPTHAPSSFTSGSDIGSPEARQLAQQSYPQQLGSSGYAGPTSYLQQLPAYVLSHGANYFNIETFSPITYQQGQQTYAQQPEITGYDNQMPSYTNGPSASVLPPYTSDSDFGGPTAVTVHQGGIPGDHATNFYWPTYCTQGSTAQFPTEMYHLTSNPAIGTFTTNGSENLPHDLPCNYGSWIEPQLGNLYHCNAA